MIKGKIGLTLIIGLSFIMMINASEVYLVKADSSILYVGGTGANSYNTIQDAVDAASNGDVINVNAGTYKENILIDRSITLVGENKDTTIIDAEGSGNVIKVTADNVNISGFTIRNSEVNLENGSITFAGIYVISNLTSILDCNIFDCHIGVILLNSSNSHIDNCVVNGNAGGIEIYNSSNCNLVNCSVTFNFQIWGVSLRRSNYNVISNCNISFNNNFGLAMSQSDNNSIFRNNFQENTKSGVYVERTSNNPGENNVFFENDFIDNLEVNALDNCVDELWDNGVKGNYWSDFDEPSEGAWDNNTDGIVDTPYSIPGEGYNDSYPLTAPIKIETDKPKQNITIDITYPKNNETVKGVIAIEGNASCEFENICIIKIVKVRIGNDAWQTADGTESWQITLDIMEYENGIHTVYVYVENENGDYLLEAIEINIQNDSNGNDNVPGFEILLVIGAFMILVVSRKIRS